LNTTHCTAKAFAKSLVVSVFPVPAGPAGAPPKYNHSFILIIFGTIEDCLLCMDFVDFFLTQMLRIKMDKLEELNH
jgi:hypothetical protein